MERFRDMVTVIIRRNSFISCFSILVTKADSSTCVAFARVSVPAVVIVWLCMAVVHNTTTSGALSVDDRRSVAKIPICRDVSTCSAQTKQTNRGSCR